jgi:hypothetical protein
LKRSTFKRRSIASFNRFLKDPNLKGHPDPPTPLRIISREKQKSRRKQKESTLHQVGHGEETKRLLGSLVDGNKKA